MSYTPNEVYGVISRSIDSEQKFNDILDEVFNTPFTLHTVHAIGAHSRINTYTVFPRDVDDVPEDLSTAEMDGDVIQLSMDYNGVVVSLYKTLQEMGIINNEGFYFNRTFLIKEDAELYLSIVKESDSVCEEYYGSYI